MDFKTLIPFFRSISIQSNVLIAVFGTFIRMLSVEKRLPHGLASPGTLHQHVCMREHLQKSFTNRTAVVQIARLRPMRKGYCVILAGLVYLILGTRALHAPFN